jgi:hypothetical protein
LLVGDCWWLGAGGWWLVWVLDYWMAIVDGLEVWLPIVMVIG